MRDKISLPRYTKSLNFDVIVVSDACCSMDDEADRSALETIERSFGYVLFTEELLGLM